MVAIHLSDRKQLLVHHYAYLCRLQPSEPCGARQCRGRFAALSRHKAAPTGAASLAAGLALIGIGWLG